MNNFKVGQRVMVLKKKYSFTKGQRVMYWPEGAKPISPVTAFISKDVETDNDTDWIGVTGINGSSRGTAWYATNIKILPTEEEVEAAKQTLMLMGDLTFKPHKPPFAPITIQGVGDYKAIVSSEVVNVGCQCIPFEVVKEIYTAVLKAEEYNKS